MEASVALFTWIDTYPNWELAEFVPSVPSTDLVNRIGCDRRDLNNDACDTDYVLRPGSLVLMWSLSTGVSFHNFCPPTDWPKWLYPFDINGQLRFDCNCIRGYYWCRETLLKKVREAVTTKRT